MRPRRRGGAAGPPPPSSVLREDIHGRDGAARACHQLLRSSASARSAAAPLSATARSYSAIVSSRDWPRLGWDDPLELRERVVVGERLDVGRARWRARSQVAPVAKGPGVIHRRGSAAGPSLVAAGVPASVMRKPVPRRRPARAGWRPRPGARSRARARACARGQGCPRRRPILRSPKACASTRGARVATPSSLARSRAGQQRPGGLPSARARAARQSLSTTRRAVRGGRLAAGAASCAGLEAREALRSPEVPSRPARAAAPR
jgi:hypothetical protein